MVFMYSFCFLFSVRLGTIIVGAMSLLQSIMGLIVCFMFMNDPQSVQKRLQEMLDCCELWFMTDIVKSMAEDVDGYLNITLTLLIIYSIACVLVVYGALKLNLNLIYPFIGLDMARILFLTANFIFAIMVIKENTMNLGLVIAYSIAGGFVLLFVYYTWFCVVSLCQMVRQLEQSDSIPVTDDKPLVKHRQRISVVGLGDFKHTSYNHYYNQYPMTVIGQAY